jgi:hypothetical protein
MADAKKALTPLHDLIRSVIDEAWAEWRIVQRFRDEKGMGAPMYPRTVSNYVFDAIARRAIPRFGAKDSAMVLIDAQSFKIYINGTLIRIKKGGEDHLGCNWPTQMALAFEELDGQLPGLPPETTKLEIIWLPNEIWTQIEQVLVVARDGDKLLWQYEIPPAAGAIIETLPIAPVTRPDTTDTGDLVKPKVAKAKKQSKS